MQKIFSGLVGGPAIDGAAQTRAISILFFGSGFAALLYQLVWQRALYRVLGVDIEAVTIVVAAFMVGLGLGSLFGGALSRQLRERGIILLAIIEFATCIYGLLSLEIFNLLGKPDPADATILPCAEVLIRTRELRPITDDNLGTEWRYPLGLE